MRNIFQKGLAQSKAAGFTLVELLIVIAIIGMLAVGILVALDPIEQTRKANDSNTLTTANEVKRAINRYYVARSCWPWETLTSGSCGLASGCSVGVAYQLAGATCGTTISTELINSGELKSYTGQLIYVVPNNGTSTTWKVSFLPSSKSLALNSVTKYQSSACAAAVSGTCATVGTNCYYCLDQ